VGTSSSGVLEFRVHIAWIRLRLLAGRVLPHLPVAMLITAYAVRFGLLSVQAQDGYADPGYDMGIFDQGVWLLSHFHAPYVTVMGRDLFGDHASFILLLAVPLYWIWPQAQTLLVLQACLIAAAAIPIYLLARRRTESTVIATALAGAYLLNPALQQGNMEQFHPESFLVLAIAVAIYAAVEWRPRVLAVAVVACLLVKEDTVLLMVPLGVWIALRRNRKWGLTIAGVSIAYALFATQVVIRFLLGTTSFYANRIPFGGVAGLLAAPFVHFGKFWDYLTSGYKPFYIWQMGASYGWIFAISPEVALIGIGTFAENVLSKFPYMQQIQYHYSLALVPVLALGTVWAVSRIPEHWLRMTAAAAVAVAAVWACYFWGLAPFSRNPVYPHMSPHDPQTLAINQVLETVPPDAVVSADYMYVSHLDHRTRIYQWPTPFRATYWYLYRQEGQRLPFAGQVQYVVIPMALPPSDQPVFRSISSQFRLVASGGGVGVYRRVNAG
jgi:uncharacterized membrane protein